MSNKKILYLSYDGLTDPLGQSQIIPYLAGLSKKGYELHIISFEKANAQVSLQKIRELLEENAIAWTPLSYSKNPPVLSTLYDIWRLKSQAKKLVKEGFGIVHCRSYVTALVGLDLKKSLKSKFIFDIRGFWADERVEGGMWPQDNWLFRHIYKFFKKKEQQFFHNADAIISLTHKAKEVIVGWGFDEDKISVTPCAVDLQKFDPQRYTQQEINDLKKELKLDDAFVLSYLGSIGSWYLLNEMMQCFKEVKKDKPKARFLILTSGSREYIESCAVENGVELSDVVSLQVPYSDVPKYLLLSDQSVFFYRIAFSRAACSPTKLGELMAMKIPVICNKGVGDTDWVVKKYGAGLCLDINQAFPSLEPKGIDREALRNGAIDYFSLESGIQTYFEVYQKLES